MLTIGSLFSGYGGLDMAAEHVMGARTAWVSDVDKGACKVLAHRLPDVPNLGDVTTTDWATVPKVDIITGGSPCQDLSTAGRRAGMTAGTRSNLWVAMREAIAHVQPTFVVWENVRGAFSARASSEMESDPRLLGEHPAGQPVLRALGRVLGDLADLGYDAEWRGLRASDVGACHQRFRIFVLAWRRDVLLPHAGHDAGCSERGIEHEIEAAGAGQSGGDATDADDAGLQGQRDPQGAAPARRYGHAEPGAGGLDLVTLPTPRSSDTNGAGEHGAGGPDLRTVVTMLPTPRATDGTKGGPNQRGSSGDLMLPSAVAQLLPTPVATDSVGARNATSGRKDGSQHHGGTTLSDVAQLLPSPETGGLLPTPSVADTQGGRKHRSGARNDELLLNGIASHERFGQYAAAVARQEAAFGYPAPSPTEPGKNRPRLSARFCEWMMGLPPGWITDVPGVTRNEALRMAGNGVVPQQAAAALRDMLPHAIAALTGRAAA